MPLSELCDTSRGWKMYDGNGHCYRYVDHLDEDTEGVTHSEAESHCNLMGGNLFSSNNEEEMTFVSQSVLL